MAVIDDKVVAMSFESDQFQSGVKDTISALDKLKAALHFPGAGKGLEEISKSAGRMDLSHIGRVLEDIKNKFTALNVTAIAVFANIASKAISAGINFAKSFTLDPIKAGFAEYSTNLNAIQTILANTQASGATLDDVNAALQDLNTYSDKTIYNFSEMAKNIGTFTAAGVDLDTSTQAIKGIANLAALSGSNSQQASTAMYQLSQAISAGRVGLQDWNSVVNAGMGGTVFQRALATTAENMGTLKEGTLKLVGPMKNVSINGESFRQSIQAGPGKNSWLTSKVLTQTLKQFTGDLSDAELKAQGFNDAQIKAIQQTAKTAQHAATEVKTISQVFDVAKETAGSGWAQTFQIIFGNFEEAKSTFTSLSNTINGFINANAEARNKVLADWKELGGRIVLIDTIKEAFHDLILILAPIKEAFREIFPATTGKDLFALTVQLKLFVDTLKPSATTIENIKRTFKGLFALLDIGKQVIIGIFGVFRQLFSVMSQGDGNFLNFTARIGDWLVKLDEALKKGDGLTKFFDGLAGVLSVPVKLIRDFAQALGDLFGGFSSGGFSSQIDGATKALNPFQRILSAVSKAWDSFTSSIENSVSVEGIIEGIGKALSGIGTALGNAFTNINFEAILAVFRTGLFGGLVLMFKQFLGRGSFLDQVSKGFAGGIIQNITGTFGALEGSMKAMQTSIKAKALKDIAIAIGLLTASVVALSFVNPEKLKSSLTAITVMLGQLLGAMAIIDKIGASKGMGKMPLVTGGLILLAGAIDILAVAVFALSKLSWEELLRGLSGVGALMGGLVVAVKPLSANSAGMIRAGIGITGIAIALNILALAVKQMAGLSWQQMAKGLTGVGGGLAALTAATMKMPAKGMIQMGIGVTALATGLKILASAMTDFAALNMKEIGKGLISVAGSLAIIAGAMRIMPKGMALQAAGLVAVAYALGLIANAMQKMGGMSQKEIEKGLIGIGGALVILAVGLTAMEGTLPGAAALTVASVGITMLAGAMLKLGSMSWTEMIKSLVAIAAAIGVLAAASVLLVEAVPFMLAMGAALLLIGGGLALAGAGVFLVGAGLSAIAVAGPAALGIMVAAFKEFTQAMIENAKLIILGVLEIVDQLAATAPKFVDALIKILDSLLNVIIRSMPKLVKAFQAILDGILKILHDNQSKIIQAGFDLIEALLKGIEKNLPSIITTAANIIVKFLDGLSKNIVKIVEAGANLIVKFLEGVAKDIGKVVEAGVNVIIKYIEGIAKKLPDIVKAGIDLLVKFLEGVAQNIGDVIDAAADVIIAYIQGIGENLGDILDAGVDTIEKFITGLGERAVELANAAGQAILDFLNGLTKAVNTYEPQIIGATISLGVAIIAGIIKGVGQKAGELWSKLEGIVSKAKHIITHPWQAFSPSRVMVELGNNIMLGLSKGIDDNSDKAYRSMTVMSEGLIKHTKDLWGIRSPSKVMHDIGQAIGQGFAEGLKGSQDDIRNAFTDLNNKMTDAIVTANDKIAAAKKDLDAAITDTFEKESKLKKLRAEAKPDQEAINNALKDLQQSQTKIKEIQAVLLENEDVLKRTTAGHDALIKTLKDEKTELIKTSGEYDIIVKKLEDAQKALADIKQARKDLVESTTAQFSAKPELDTTTPEDLKSAKDQIAEEQKNLNDAKAENNDAKNEVTKQQIALDAARADFARTQGDKDADELQKAKDDIAKQEEDLQNAKDAQINKQDATAKAQVALDGARSEYSKLIEDKVLDKSGLAVDQLKTYEKALVHQTNSVAAYNATLQALRKLGLDDATYKKLVDDGVADAAFAKQLLAGGQTAVTALNKLDTRLQTVSQKLGTNVGREMFASGQKAAQKIVDGFVDDKKTKQKKIAELGHEIMTSLKTALEEGGADVGDVMERIGDNMVARMKKALGMKSPSKEMMAIGRFSMLGLAQGLTDSTDVLTKATDQVASDALTAMQKSMQSIHGAVLNELDATPVITPILDLSIVRTQSRELNALTSFGQASIISAQQTAAQADQTATTIAGASVQFNQNNYSPESLNAIEIYRQTRNQLSQIKSVLGVT